MSTPLPDRVVLLGSEHPDYGHVTWEHPNPWTACALSVGSDPASPSLRFKGDADGAPNEDALLLLDDGRHALTGGLDGQLRLWDLKKGRCLRELGGPGPRLTAIALVAGGLFALASSVDGQVRIYSVHGGGSLAQLEGHAGAVRALAATPDGRFVVTAGEDRSLRLWEIDWELDPEGAFVALGQAPQGKFMQRLTAIFRKRT